MNNFIFEIKYVGNNKYLLNNYKFCNENDIIHLINYNKFKKEFVSFLRLLKINKLKGNNDNKFIDHIIYKTKIVWDLRSNPGFSNARLKYL